MNIIVMGGSGQLGRCINKISGEYSQHTFTFKDLPDVDITDLQSVDKAVRESKADVIINCAAFTSTERAEKEGAPDALWVNVQGPAVIAEAALANGAKVVHISTDYVFPGGKYEPLTEEDEVEPLNVYGITKLAGEKRLFASGADAAVIRTSWLFSEFGDNFVRTMLRKADEGDDIRVLDDKVGTPTYAADLAKAIMAVIENGIEGAELYHYSNAGEATWYEFALEIFRQAGKNTMVTPITSAEYSSPVKRPDYSVLDSSKIKSLGVETPQWEEALGRCLSELK